MLSYRLGTVNDFLNIFGEEKERQEDQRGPRSLTWGKGQGEAIYRGPLMLSTKYW